MLLYTVPRDNLPPTPRRDNELWLFEEHLALKMRPRFYRRVKVFFTSELSVSFSPSNEIYPSFSLSLFLPTHRVPHLPPPLTPSSTTTAHDGFSFCSCMSVCCLHPLISINTVRVLIVSGEIMKRGCCWGFRGRLHWSLNAWFTIFFCPFITLYVFVCTNLIPALCVLVVMFGYGCFACAVSYF